MNKYGRIPEWLLFDRCVSEGAKVLYAVLTRFANDATGECRPSIPTLCELLDSTRNTVRKWLRELEGVGAITAKRGPGGRAVANHYFLAADDRPETRKGSARSPLCGTERGQSRSEKGSIQDAKGVNPLTPNEVKNEVRNEAHAAASTPGGVGVREEHFCAACDAPAWGWRADGTPWCEAHYHGGLRVVNDGEG